MIFFDHDVKEMKQIFGFLRRDKTPLLLIVAMAALWAALCLITNKSFAGPTAYNTYTRQAMAWRDGLLHLP